VSGEALYGIPVPTVDVVKRWASIALSIVFSSLIFYAQELFTLNLFAHKLFEHEQMV